MKKSKKSKIKSNDEVAISSKKHKSSKHIEDKKTAKEDSEESDATVVVVSKKKKKLEKKEKKKIKKKKKNIKENSKEKKEGKKLNTESGKKRPRKNNKKEGAKQNNKRIDEPEKSKSKKKKKHKKEKIDAEVNRKELSEPNIEMQKPASPQIEEVACEIETKWKKVGEEVKKKDIVTYKILEIGKEWQPRVSGWRCGIVSKVRPKNGSDEPKTIKLRPWPDPLVHPDPLWKPPEIKEQEDEEVEFDENGYIIFKKVLENPQSEYGKHGTLKKRLDQFHDIRYFGVSEKEASLVAEKNAKVKKSKKKSKKDKRKKSKVVDSDKEMNLKQGMCGVLNYLKSTGQI